MSRYQLGRDGLPSVDLRHELDAQVRLVPDLPVPNARQALKAAAVPSRNSSGEGCKLRNARANGSVVRALFRSGFNPGRRGEDGEKRRQTLGGYSTNRPIEVSPRVPRISGVWRVEPGRLDTSPRRDKSPSDTDSDKTRTGLANVLTKCRLPNGIRSRDGVIDTGQQRSWRRGRRSPAHAVGARVDRGRRHRDDEHGRDQNAKEQRRAHRGSLVRLPTEPAGRQGSGSLGLPHARSEPRGERAASPSWPTIDLDPYCQTSPRAHGDA